MFLCTYKGCPETGRWYPQIVVKAANNAEAKALIPVRLCDLHKRTTTIREWLTDDAWSKILTALSHAGFATPIRNSSELRFVHCDDAKPEQFLH